MKAESIVKLFHEMTPKNAEPNRKTTDDRTSANTQHVVINDNLATSHWYCHVKHIKYYFREVRTPSGLSVIIRT